MAKDRTEGALPPHRAEEVLAFWFDELEPRHHFVRDAEVDAMIAERFGALHAELAKAIPDDWRDTPRHRLAAIIVLDQFSRNLFRDDPRAFAQDAAALALAKDAIAAGDGGALSGNERSFLFMPLMHSETLADVDRCIALMDEAGHKGGADFARKHADVIARFGRYPARNAALGRETTPEEAEFLAANPSGF